MTAAQRESIDHYRTLQVERTASEAQIREAFRKLARVYHPDVNPDNKDNERKFKEINAAYQVLSDPNKRRQYDEQAEQRERAAKGEKSRERAAWEELHRQEQNEMAREKARQEEERRRQAHEELRKQAIQKPSFPGIRAEVKAPTAARPVSPEELRRRGLMVVRRWAVRAAIVILAAAAAFALWRLL